jgi:hypothetical protein
MNPIVRNILAVVAGFVSGALVNMLLVSAGPLVFPPPPGADMTTPAGIKAALPLLQPQHFVFPFLAHAANAFVGALVAYLVAGSRREVFAWALGGLTLLGGVAAAFMIPAPAWFLVLDLGLAYLPMAWLAIHVGRRVAATPAA